MYYLGGSVGIGTSTPAAKLDVNGSIKVNNDATTCSSVNAGAIRWSGTALQGCDGASWAPLTSAPPQLKKQIFTSSGIFTYPTGTTTSTVYKVTVVGGGGSGGNYAGGNGGSGGAAGGACIKWVSGMIAGQTTTITVGSGGTAVDTSITNNLGNVGSGSSFSGGCSASGGGGAVGGYNGGAGTGGDINLTGGQGEGSHYVPSAANGAGGGGNSIFGGAGAGGGQINSGRLDAAGYGSGGAGGYGTLTNSGAGASGIVIVEWTQ